MVGKCMMGTHTLCRGFARENNTSTFIRAIARDIKNGEAKYIVN